MVIGAQMIPCTPVSEVAQQRPSARQLMMVLILAPLPDSFCFGSLKFQDRAIEVVKVDRT